MDPGSPSGRLGGVRATGEDDALWSMCFLPGPDGELAWGPGGGAVPGCGVGRREPGL